MSEVKKFSELPLEIQALRPGHWGMEETIILAFNAGVRAGREAGVDVRAIAATLYSVARIHHGIPDPFSGAVRDADALIAALAKEKP